ncbi:MAG: hypothetical protein WKG07_22140 [Hymenobacter sp.]
MRRNARGRLVRARKLNGKACKIPAFTTFFRPLTSVSRNFVRNFSILPTPTPPCTCTTWPPTCRRPSSPTNTLPGSTAWLRDWIIERTGIRERRKAGHRRKRQHHGRGRHPGPAGRRSRPSTPTSIDLIVAGHLHAARHHLHGRPRRAARRWASTRSRQ